MLQILEADTELTFQELLERLHISEDNYILAIISTLKDPRIFRRRDPDSMHVNGYNPAVLLAWRANHDIQCITNAYACAMYNVGYISKGQRGMSIKQVKIMSNPLYRSV